jgi:FkbH-like protein
LVFLDDNPAERALIRQELPMVAVPELPDDPSSYSDVLLSAGFFEATRFTDDDQLRNRHYADNALRAEMRVGISDIDQYLVSLGMVVEFERFSPLNRARVVQLINKTNQFNLTTQRTSEAEVAALEARHDVFTLVVRLRDRFGDNGLISALICNDRDGRWHITTWVMSCRVFQRRIEQAVLNYLAAAARRANVKTLIGHYSATSRNGLVRELYPSLGFRPTEAVEGEAWALDLEGFSGMDVPIREAAVQDNPA